MLHSIAWRGGVRPLPEIGRAYITEILSRAQGATATTWFPELTAELAKLPAGTILDGEVCVLDDIERSDFNRLHARALRRRWYAGADLVVLAAFDLLAHRFHRGCRAHDAGGSMRFIWLSDVGPAIPKEAGFQRNPLWVICRLYLTHMFEGHRHDSCSLR